MGHLLIIGGSDAGIAAALRAREGDRSVQVRVLLADRFPNHSICGLPFYLSGEVADWRKLAHRKIEEIESEGIHLLLNHVATKIDPRNRIVSALNEEKEPRKFKYDRLIIATGAASARPSIEGLDLPGVFFLRWMGDGFAIHQYMSEHHPKSAAIIGSGYIGMEMADALTYRGLSVTVFARSGSLLKTVDPEMGEMIRGELLRHGVKVVHNVSVSAIEREGERLALRIPGGPEIKTDLVLVATGGAPATQMAREAGVLTGLREAIKVNAGMKTNIEDVYAAGDCVETWHRLLKQPVHLPLGTTAHKQGRVAGENAVGGQARFSGSLGTQVVKIFDIVVARTGLRDQEAKNASFDPFTAELDTWDHKAYYPGATTLRIRITGDRGTHQLLGAQMIGHHGAEVAKRIDIFSTALFNSMKVEDLNSLDLSYTPPLGSPWDPVQTAAQAWQRTLNR